MPASAKKPRIAPETDLSAQCRLEREVTSIFSDLAHLLGSPRSYGEIFGLLFISKEALTMEEIIFHLGISKGSASQGLRVLTEIGAVRRVKSDGSRSHGYLAEMELKRLLSGFLRERFNPHLERGADRLQDLNAIVSDLPEEEREDVGIRLEKLLMWHKRAMEALPFALKLLQDD